MNQEKCRLLSCMLFILQFKFKLNVKEEQEKVEKYIKGNINHYDSTSLLNLP